MAPSKSDTAADKPKRARKPAATKEQQDVEQDPSPQDAPTKPKKRAKKAAADQPENAASASPSAAPAAENAEPTDAEPPKRKRPSPKPLVPVGPVYDPDTMRPPRYQGSAHRLLAWNVAGLRALLKKNGDALSTLVERESLDVLCLQETKLQGQHCEEIAVAAGLGGWHMHWLCSNEKKGYSGVATLCREAPLSVVEGMGRKEHDDEGRVLTVELPDLFVVNAYTPNSGEGLRRLDYRVGPSGWDACFAKHVASLVAKGKPVVVAGDLNCAHKDIDIHEPKRNLKSAGFTPEERASFSKRILAPEPATAAADGQADEADDGASSSKKKAKPTAYEKAVAEGYAAVEKLVAEDESNAGLVDVFRARHPGVVAYTYFSYRSRGRETGKGWRLDYCLVSQGLVDRVHDAFILPGVEGSDHVPHGLVIRRD